MSGPAKFIITGDVAQAEREAIKLEKRIESLEQKMKRFNEENKRSSGINPVAAAETAMTSLAAKTMSFAAVGSAAQQVLAGMSAKAEEFHGKIAKFQADQMPAQLKAQLAMGFDAEAMKRVMPNLKAALFQTPALSLPEMTTMQSEIAGAGFADADVASGAAAKAMLRVRAGMGTFGKDSENVGESAKAISGLLAAQGSALDAKGIERVGMRTAALAAKTNLAFSDLKQLSQAAGALSQLGVDESTMLSAFSVTSEAGGSQTGGTGLKNIGLRLGSPNDEQTKALEAIGLTPADVAISKGGIDFTTAGERLRGALAQKNEVEKNAFYSKFFGGDAVSSAALLFSDEGFKKFRERTGIAENAQGEMGKRLATFEASRLAVGRRHGLKEEFALHDEAERGRTWDEHQAQQAAYHAQERAGATSSFGRARADAGAFLRETLEGVNRRTGFDPGDMGLTGFITHPFGKGSSNADWGAIAKQQLEAAEKQNALMEENNRLLRDQQGKKPLAVQGQKE